MTRTVMALAALIICAASLVAQNAPTGQRDQEKNGGHQGGAAGAAGGAAAG